ncbi:ABC transporter ATP-binding protein [Natronomonas marina]|jgi:peptide/nickel transport system ATP-binding protein|uniref:ABC transporter ATP-binding protein n=1 Tax=Natronomonas marina TaxID=2961939 RepID=UPI0020C93A36|nr:ABC transporter ATP-binding protein [Natronomonas marina]
MSEDPLLEVRDLEKHFPITEGLFRRETGRVRAVDGVSFEVGHGETFGLVGESGCGKSTTALSLLRLEEPTGGEVRFDGEDVLEYDGAELRSFRRRVQLVLQDPDSAFNPRRTVGEAVAEPLEVHGIDDPERRRRVVEDTLERVGLSASDADDYPHEFSGGEKQRIAIARALVLNPDLIVADEPVSALDGRTKTDVLALLGDLQREFDLSVLLISHDIGLIRRFCDRIGVMYLGSLVETGTAAEVVEDPKHPYTRMLVSSVPSLDPAETSTAIETPSEELPDAADVPSGCRFHPRCPAIVPPESVELPRERWLDVVGFRFHLDDEWDDAATLRSSLSSAGGEVTSPESIRERFDLGDPLGDEAVEAAVADAAEAIANDDLERARTRLEAATETVCERHSPDRTVESDGRTVACHRYDPDEPGEPLADAGSGAGLE